MATKIETILIDDLNGKVDDTVETHTLSWDGKAVEFELNAKNLAKVLKVIDPILEAGRPVKKRDGRHHVKKHDPELVAKIKAWAKDNGIEVNDRGRVPKAVVAQYTDAMREAAK